MVLGYAVQYVVSSAIIKWRDIPWCEGGLAAFGNGKGIQAEQGSRAKPRCLDANETHETIAREESPSQLVEVSNSAASAGAPDTRLNVNAVGALPWPVRNESAAR